MYPANLITEDRWGVVPLLYTFWGYPIFALELSVAIPWSHIQLDDDVGNDGEVWHTKRKHWQSASCKTDALPLTVNWLGSFAWQVCKAFMCLFWSTISRTNAISCHVWHVIKCGNSRLQSLKWFYYQHDPDYCFWIHWKQWLFCVEFKTSLLILRKNSLNWRLLQQYLSLLCGSWIQSHAFIHHQHVLVTPTHEQRPAEKCRMCHFSFSWYASNF